jgi:hypothetical protein
MTSNTEPVSVTVSRMLQTRSNTLIGFWFSLCIWITTETIYDSVFIVAPLRVEWYHTVSGDCERCVKNQSNKFTHLS